MKFFGSSMRFLTLTWQESAKYDMAKQRHTHAHTHNQRISEKILVIGWTILVNLRDPEIVAAVSFDRFKAAMFGNHWAWTSPVVPCHFLLPFVRT